MNKLIVVSNPNVSLLLILSLIVHLFLTYCTYDNLSLSVWFSLHKLNCDVHSLINQIKYFCIHFNRFPCYILNSLHKTTINQDFSKSLKSKRFCFVSHLIWFSGFLKTLIYKSHSDRFMQVFLIKFVLILLVLILQWWSIL